MEAQGAPSNKHVTHIAQDGPDAALSRREKRKGWKKAKRSERRQQAAEKARQDEELRKQDPSFHLQQAQALENERLEHELQEKLWLEREKEAQEEADRKRQKAVEKSEAIVEDDDNTWDYVEEGPAEIIWEGNEIIVRKQKVKVPKTQREKLDSTEDDHPVSNPLLPESLYRNSHSLASNSLPSQNAAFEDHKKLVHSTPLSSNEHNPNFGTEQDKTHCPFHIKTGVCRFGVNCSRAHVYPDKSCTLLIKNMYNGPGLPLEHDEGLEYTDEEVLQNYEEFFEDVHGEFLKYGEIANFKVCRNESSHLRGNVYAQFQSVDSAVAAYNALNGRFYAGKQITCEFVVVIRWRAALCGEYMRSHHKVCSHGTACNFLHCFRNPCGLYDWADWDNAPPRSFLATGHRRRGDSIEATTFQDKYNHRHDGHSHRHHRDNFSPKRMRSHQTSGKHVSRERRYKSHYNDDSSCEESLSGDRDGFQKVRRRWSSDKRSRYKGRHNSTSSSEESLSVEREGLREDRRHRSSDRRSGEMGLAIREDASTKQKEYIRKKRHESRSQDRYKRRQHGGSHDVSRTRGVTGKRSVSQGDGRSRSHESSESVVSSELGTFCKVTLCKVTQRSRQHTRNRCSSDERYKPRSRSTSYDSLEQSPEDEMGTKKRSRNSSNKCMR